MKYKNINAMAHNFAHSFLSLTNYFDEGYVKDDVLEYANNLKSGEPFLIQLIPADVQKDALFNERIKKSISSHRERFSRHCRSHNVEPHAISLFQISLVKTPSHELLACANVVDDKGKKYEQYVRF